MKAEVVRQEINTSLPSSNSDVICTDETPNTSKVTDAQRMYVADDDETVRILTHPLLQSINPKGRLSPREWLVASITLNLARDHAQGNERRAQIERVSAFAWFSRMFGNNVSSVLATPPEPTGAKKSFWEKLNPSVVVPLIVILLVALASWKTAETNSWKGVADANKQLADTNEKHWNDVKQENKDLTQKNDDLNNQIRDLLVAAAQDKATDTTTLIAKLNKIIGEAKPKPQPSKNEAPANHAGTAGGL